MDKIEVKGMRFHAYHGCHPGERQVGGLFEVDVELAVDLAGFKRTDEITSTIDYVAVMHVVRDEMDQPKNLIEAVAASIGHRLRERFSQAREARVTVRKLSPPVGYEVDYVSTTIKV